MSKKQYIYGLHSTMALLNSQADRIVRLYLNGSRSDEKILPLIELATAQGVNIEFVPRHQLDRMVEKANHQGVVALAMAAHIFGENDIERLLQTSATPPLVLVLDGVQDPHNLGACFRTADAAGVTAIIAPKDKSVSITPVVSKVASGAAETVPFVQVTNLVRALEKLKACGLWIYGADEAGEQSLFQANLSSVPLAIILGAEGKGLRHLTRQHCDMLVNIPMKGSVSSLNVSVAAGICLFEILRQRASQA